MPSVSQFWLYPFLTDGNQAILQFQTHKGYTSIPIRNRGISFIPLLGIRDIPLLGIRNIPLLGIRDMPQTSTTS